MALEKEIEARFLDVDIEKMRETLKETGGVMIHPERLMRRQLFDFKDKRLAAVGGWVRIREEGDKITMSYKQITDQTINGIKEAQLVIDNAEQGRNFLEALGVCVKGAQENKRETWNVDDCEVVIDSWPWVPTCIEVEGPNEETVRRVAEKLGYSWDQALFGAIEPLYMAYYDVSAEEVLSWKEMTFSPVPEELAAKAKSSSSLT